MMKAGIYVWAFTYVNTCNDTVGEMQTFFAQIMAIVVVVVCIMQDVDVFVTERLFRVIARN